MVDSSKQTTPDLYELIDLFFDDPDELGRFEEVDVEEMPEPFRGLLAHQEHMTETVEAFHECPSVLEVLAEKLEGDFYSRKILLRRSTDHGVIQYGIVKLDLSVLDPPVQAEIRAKRTPLGRILINHNVLRTVRLIATWKIRPSGELRELLSGNRSIVYGRTALLYCNGKPAVQLLEIVSD